MAKASQNALLFDEKEAIEFLQSRGYRVIKNEELEGVGISTVPQLVKFFYARRLYYNGDRKFPESMDSAKDRSFIGGFVQSRQKLGVDRKTAVKECVRIIDALFKYEELLGLDDPILSPRILGVRSITDRVCSFLNGDIPETGETDTEEVIKKYNDYYNRHFADEDYRLADARRKSMREILDEQE